MSIIHIIDFFICAKMILKEKKNQHICKLDINKDETFYIAIQLFFSIFKQFEETFVYHIYVSHFKQIEENINCYIFSLRYVI